MTRSLFVWQPHSERFNSPSSPPECHLNCVIYSVKAAHTGRGDWHLLTNRALPPLVSITTECYSARGLVFAGTKVFVHGERKGGERNQGGSSLAGSAAKCQCHTQQLEVLRAESLKEPTEPLRGLKKGSLWMQRPCQFFCSFSAQTWATTSQLTCVTLSEHRVKAANDRLPSNRWGQCSLYLPGSATNDPLIMMASRIKSSCPPSFQWDIYFDDIITDWQWLKTSKLL